MFPVVIAVIRDWELPNAYMGLRDRGQNGLHISRSMYDIILFSQLYLIFGRKSALIREFGTLHVNTWQIGDSGPWLIPPTQIPLRNSRAWENFPKVAILCTQLPPSSREDLPWCCLWSWILLFFYASYQERKKWKLRPSLEFIAAFIFCLWTSKQNSLIDLCNLAWHFQRVLSIAVLALDINFKNEWSTFWMWNILYMTFYLSLLRLIQTVCPGNN